MSAKPPSSVKERREGKATKVLRFIITFSAVGAFIAHTMNFGFFPEDILSYLFTWAMLQLIVTFFVWLSRRARA